MDSHGPALAMASSTVGLISRFGGLASLKVHEFSTNCKGKYLWVYMSIGMAILLSAYVPVRC